MGITNRLVFDPTDAASIAASSSLGAYLRAEDGTLLTHTTNGAREELDVNDKAVADLLTTIDGVIDNIYTEQQDQGTTLDNIETELLDQGSVLDNIYTEQQDQGTTLDSIETEVLDQGTTLDNIETELLDQGSVLDNIYTEQQDQGTTLDSIETSIQVLDDIVLAEDSVHASGDKGVMPLVVRQDSLSSLVSADGDYSPLSVDADGALYVTLGNELNIDTNDVANVAIQNTATAVSASAVNVVSSALAERTYLFLANEGNKSLYFGKNGVTAVNGFPIHPGEKLECRIGPSVAPQVIGEATASSEDLRVMELS